MNQLELKPNSPSTYDLGSGRDSLPLSLLMLMLEAWLYVITIQYWWWGQVYLKSAVLLWIALSVAMVVPSIPFGKRASISLTRISKILMIPSIVAFGFIMAFYFGLPDFCGRYIYQSTLMMGVFTSCLIGVLITKWRYLRHIENSYIHTREQANYRIRKSKQEKLQLGLPEWSLVLDIIVTAGFCLLIINIEGIMIALYSI